MNNKFKTASVVSSILSISTITVWSVQTIIVYQNYLKHPEYSAPFWAYQIPEVTAYGIPVIVGLILTVVFKRKAMSSQR